MKKILLIDGHSILNRAYYGLPDLTNAKGQHTNAVYGFLTMMFRYIDQAKPDLFLVAFDVSEPTFRHKMFSEYKGTRKKMDPELKEQVPMIQTMLTAMQVPIIKKAGLEADDILGTIAKESEQKGYEVTIMSGDRDLLQLASEHIKICIPKTKKTGNEIEEYFAKDVLEQKKVTPEEFIDVKALWGDTADNIPGVPQIGEKTATEIIRTYHTLENAYQHVQELKPPRASKNLAEYYEQALLSKKLATIETHAQIDYDLKDASMENLFSKEAYALCKEWGFKNLLGHFEKEEVEEKNPVEDRFYNVEELAEAENLFTNMQKQEMYIGISILCTQNSLHAVSLSDGENTFFIRAQGFITEAYLKDKIEKQILLNGKISSRDIKKIGHILKLPSPKQTFDTAVAAYLLDPLKNSYPPEDLAQEFLGMYMPSYESLFKKQSEIEADAQNPDEMQRFMCYDAYTSAKLPEILEKKLEQENMASLFWNIEMPLVFTLTDMETAGMAMDGEALKVYGKDLQNKIEELEQTIYAEAGEKFNINSPKQMGEILFEKLQLPVEKKTKTGYSTAAGVLEKLAQEYPIVQDILEYRKLSKLKSTYADGLAAALMPDGRIHSTFQQTVTATGRISSTDPNLQNIPIRMELGKKIRKVFYPQEGYCFLDADYSQIELRVLAHLSQDENLLQAYRENQDIHRATAALVFHTPFEEVTELQRRNAKAVNFGIVYGISAYGLSQDLNIARKEAQKYIDDYFTAYPKLKVYLDTLVADAKEKGYAITLFGRKRPIPELSSSNFMQRQFGERIAMNSPIQGTAADIIKAAMVAVHDRLKREHLMSRLVLQVHDELLIETKTEEMAKVRQILAEEMHNAAKLSVPLEIDMHDGMNWYDAK